MKLKTILLGVLLSLVFLLGIGGCDTSPQSTAQPAVIMRVLDPSLEPFAKLWQAEIGRRFPNAVGVLVHGGDFVEGQWIVGDWRYRSGMHVRPIADIVYEAHVAYPGRTIVLLACNTGHLPLGIPGVYYAKSSVWCVPDRDVELVPASQAREKLWFGSKPKPASAKLDAGRWATDPDVVGNIFEFVAD